VCRSLPGGGHSVHYRGRVGVVQRCRVCGRSLAGLPRLAGVEASRLSRGDKTVGRPFGGQVCPDCFKRGLMRAARSG
jgi:large subunit ribosomal protein L34e